LFFCLTDFGFERRRSFEKTFFFFFSVPRPWGFLWKRWFEEDEQKEREAALLQWVVKPSKFFVLHVENNRLLILFKPPACGRMEKTMIKRQTQNTTPLLLAF
jgi:hypothetical protein